MYKNENAQLFSILKRLNKDMYLNHYLYQKKTTQLQTFAGTEKIRNN